MRGQNYHEAWMMNVGDRKGKFLDEAVRELAGTALGETPRPSSSAEAVLSHFSRVVLGRKP